MVYQLPNYGEKIDGRILFHQRRSELHEKIAVLSIKAMADPAYCREWCSALMQLQRMMYGSLHKVPNMFLRKSQYVKDNITMPFNDYLERMLVKIMKQIMDATSFVSRGDGTVKIISDRDKLKDIPYKLDKIQKQINEIEYVKNLDLPRRDDPVVKATRAGR